MDLPRLLAITDYQGMQKRFEETRERLQKKVSRLCGELVVAVSRDYKPFRMSVHELPSSYSVSSLLEVGVIGDKTVFGDLTGNLSPLMSNLQSAAYLHHGGDFLKRNPPEFQGINYKGLFFLADMDEPPQLPEVDWRLYKKPFEFPIRGSQGPSIHKTKDSRLELQIGNSTAVPYLKGSLAEGRLRQLSDILDIAVKINLTNSF